MKRLLLVILCILCLSGCKTDPFKLDSEYYNKNELIDVKSNELAKLENSKKSFAVFVYTDGCITCRDFKVVLNEFQEKHNITFYSISAPEMKKTTISKYIKYTPSVILYNNGEIVAYLDAESDKDKEYYKTLEGFEKWFDTYIISE